MFGFAMVLASCNNSNNGTQANFNGFTKVNDTTYSITVSNETEILNLSDIVSINEKSSWKLTTDIQANNVIPSKVASLKA